MHWRFIHRKKDALTGRSTAYLHRHPTIEIQEGLYNALRPIAKAKGYTSVNALIAGETPVMLMNILLESEA